MKRCVRVQEFPSELPSLRWAEEEPEQLFHPGQGAYNKNENPSPQKKQAVIEGTVNDALQIAEDPSFALNTAKDQLMSGVLEVTLNVDTPSATTDIESDKAFQLYVESVQSDSVGFFVNAELEPPTAVSNQAPECPSKSSSKQEWLPDGKMHRRLREWINDGGLKIEKGVREEDQGQTLEATIQRARMLEIELYPWLESLSPHLKEMFRRRMGHGALDNWKWKPAQEYSALFQLLMLDKSTMQTMTRSVLRKLELFLKEPTPNNHADLLGVPALYTILWTEYTKEKKYAPETLGVARWMLLRTAAVLKMLLSSNQEPLRFMTPENFHRFDSSPEIRDWERVNLQVTIYVKIATYRNVRQVVSTIYCRYVSDLGTQNFPMTGTPM
ncbi:hypothetical protein GYMLUDRAFT_248828 [Collybiopsis luxurians FD-317 M1]|uniref:Uncharacterized protein n=1 Tax=Collybiopsis luxurians FD-317 M1 TaxID=944289 RepID=A0A0D0AX82_9AGAR|nr:hypothetical protein GYMLUDRAFT_248828 [Collybiopsis luxurians FD-317 M1]